MGYLYIIGIAVGLAMDAFAVSVTNGFLIKELRVYHAFKIALFFGLFQAVMPLIGWLGGISLVKYIKGFDHWIAFGLLAFIGGKMIYESRSDEMNEEKDSKNALHLPTLLFLSVATSIDALAVGLSFGVLNVPVIVPVIVIGSITFVLCLLGVYLGNKFGHLFESKLELIGGIILILIGLKILVDHLFLNGG